MRKSQRPPSGTNVDETRVVTLLPGPNPSSVSVRLGDAKVFLAKRQLEEMAAEAAAISKIREASPKRLPEEQRLRMISGSRAKELLDVIANHADESGHLADTGKLNSQMRYLLSRMLEDGDAAVISLKTGRIIPTLTVHYKGTRAGPTSGQGTIRISCDVEGATRFLLMVDWWVS
jgi:hypothetical protein